MVEWNSDFSYAIGLFTADGNMSSDGRHLEFCSKDLELIKIIKKYFNLNNKIGRKHRGTYPKKWYHRIQFGNKELYSFFIKIGLTPNKSKSLTYLKIPKKYFCDFLRGLIDGDGTIDYFMHPESKEKQFRIRISSASKDFLEWLNREINEFLDIKGTIRQSLRSYQLCYYKKASRIMVDFIYYRRSVISLNRKFEIAKLMKTREWWNWETRTV